MAKQKILTRYQREVVCTPWYTSDGRHALTQTFCKARRIGGSTAAAFIGALRALGRELRPDGSFVQHEPADVWVVSKDFPSSKGLLREIASVCRELEPLDPEFEVDAQATVIRFKSGKTATALPCSDKAVRSWTGFYLCDEVAFWRQVDEMWAAAKAASGPTLGEPRGYGMLLVSTPWDEASLAHRLFTDESFGFIRHSVDIYQAKADGFPIDIDRVRAELGVPELFASEFECKWSRGGSSFFPETKLRDAQEDNLPVGWEKAPCRIGIDVGGGRGRDFTAAVQWRDIASTQWMVGVKAFNNLPIDVQVEVIGDWVLGIDPAVHVDMRADQGVMGLDLIRLLSKKLKDRKRLTIIGVSMNPTDQERYAVSGRRLLERKQISLYTGKDAGGDENGARALMLELANLKSKPGTGGHLTFVTPRDPQRGHCDRAWASLIGLEDADDVNVQVNWPTSVQGRARTQGRWSGMGGRGFG